MAHYTKEQLRKIFQNKFNREAWKAIVIEIFGANKVRKENEQFTAPEDPETGYFMGSIDTLDSYRIGLFYYKINSGSVVHKKVGLRNLVRQFINQNWGEFDAAIVVFDDNKHWRLSFVCDIKEEATAPKRFTYVFGEKDNFYKTAIERFDFLQRNGASFENIRSAFSVEALSKNFFNEYRELYADFVEYITGKRFVRERGKWVEKKQSEPNELFSSTFCSDEKTVRDYVKKMFGRIVFLYFLQRKGWLAGNKNYMHDLFTKSSQQDNFLDGVLEPLFFDLLNTKPEQRPQSSKSLPGSENIPYLNGGLFEKDEIDPERCVFPASYFKRLFSFLDSYNFTIDENNVEDAEIGIDPEMLGRIFENLLEDNKDKGAFYTPKEIVDYMCRESLIAYLNNGYESSAHPTIRKFIETNDPDVLNDEQKMKLLRKLVDVKICDPAIGSGAFPMGLVNLLSRIFIVLKPDSDTTKIKRHIMENSIYGVDIEKGAIDIARLRFWLAMVVDEKEPQPLPNLHFKIMQGNSLLESYENISLADMTKVKGQGRLFDSDDSEREDLIKALKRYYKTSDHEDRGRLFNYIIGNVRRQLYAKGIVLPQGMDPSENSEFFLWHTWFSDVFDKGGFDIVIGNPPYIQLQGNAGFLANLYEHCNFKSFARTGDIYALFYEQGYRLLKDGGHLCFITSNKWMRAGYGKNLRDFLSKNTDTKLLIDFGGIQIFDSATVDTNILLFSKKKNKGATQAISCSKQDRSILKNLSDFVRQNAVETDFSTSDSWVILSPIELSIKRKIEAVGTPLKDWDINIYRGVLTGCNEAFIISTEKRNEILNNCQSSEERKRTEELIRPILRGRDIKRYGYDWAGLYLIATFPSRHYDIEEYPAVKEHLLSFGKERLEQTGKEYIVNGQKIKARKKTNNKWFETQDSISYWDDFNKQKIVWARLMRLTKKDVNSFPRFANVPEGFMTVDSLCFFSGKDIDIICHFLNSEYAAYYFLKNIVALDNGGIQMRQQYIEEIPLPQTGYTDEEIYSSFGFTSEEISSIKNFIQVKKQSIFIERT